MGNWSYGKIILTGLVCFVAVLGGVWVGNEFFQPEPQLISLEGKHTYEDDLDARYVSFTSGDHFPWESYLTLEGDSSSYEALRDGRPAIFIFATTGCRPCLSLLAHWQDEVQAQLRSDVLVALCVPADMAPLPEDFLALTGDLPITLIDRDYWGTMYDMSFWPTIIAVDGSGFVQHIQIGYANVLDAQFRDYHARAN